MSDKELREAARAYEKSLLASLPEPEDCAGTFSPAFERRMKKLILRVDHPVRYWLARLLPVLLLAGAAVIAAAVLLGGEAPAETDPVPPPAAEERTVVYRLTWLPEGFALDRETQYDGEGMAVYAAPDGGEAVFLYALEGSPAEGADLSGGRTVPVGDGTGTLCLGQSKGTLNDLFWTDGEASFWLSAPFGEEDMIRAAGSVEALLVRPESVP